MLLLLAYTGLAYIPIAIDQAAFARELKRASQLSNGKAELARYSRAKGGDLSYFKQDGQVVGFYASPDYATLSPIASQHFYTKIYFKGDRVTDWDDIEVGTVAP